MQKLQVKPVASL